MFKVQGVHVPNSPALGGRTVVAIVGSLQLAEAVLVAATSSGNWTELQIVQVS